LILDERVARAEFDAGQAASFGVAHAAREILANLHGDVKFELVVEIVLDATAKEEGAEAKPEIVHLSRSAML